MLDADIRLRIDNARQVLVGVIPDPKGQIEFITAALIYKYLADSDDRAERGGDKRTFFVGDYAGYDWRNLLDMSKSGEERLLLYEGALKKIAGHPDVPPSFRAIFGGAALPFRDARTLNLFLTEIDGIACKRAEDMGTPYEYLLSIMGANQSAGQFRTPQHIIDFIVAITDPQKGDRLCDPACGTAGFLIAAHRHIMLANGGKKPGDQLTPQERRTLTSEWRGYDIDPGMTRLAMANAFVHGIFGEGIVRVYDSLTNADHWNEKYDIILANPPFMSPKGGIQPHNLFMVQARRAEVLFADYIGEHLAPNGRAGIVVPEGVIFQAQRAYTHLRKMLVEEWGLHAVVSLPAGVFQPYSGVKTSILLLDKGVRGCKKVLFVNIANDGFDLGAQRREIDKNDLPQAQKIISRWREKQTIAKGITIAHAVAKDKIADDDSYDLTGNRYRIKAQPKSGKWQVVKLGDICEFKRGKSITKKEITPGNIPVVAGGQSPAYYHSESNRPANTITISSSGAYAGFVNYYDVPVFASDCFTLHTLNEDKAQTKFLYYFLKQNQKWIYSHASGAGIPHIYPRNLKNMPIPLPPLEIQQEIVAEIDGWQKIITGAQQIINNWQPHIAINANWKTARLGDVITLHFGTRITKKENAGSKYPVYGGGGESFRTDNCNREGEWVISRFAMAEYCVRFVPGKFYLMDSGLTISIAPDRKDADKQFIGYLLSAMQGDIYAMARGNAQKNLHISRFNDLQIPLPPLKEQQKIAAQIDTEQQAVATCRNLIDTHKQKIARQIAEVWV